MTSGRTNDRGGERSTRRARASNGLRHSAVAPMRAVGSRIADGGEIASSGAIDGSARAMGGMETSGDGVGHFSMRVPSGLSRSQQVFLAQKLFNAPAVPSFARDEGGMVLDRVIANVGSGRWWTTVTARVRAQRAWNTEQVQEGKAHRALLDASMYALGGRFRMNLLENVALKAVGELGSARAITRAITKKFVKKNETKSDAIEVNTGEAREDARARVLLQAKIPRHVINAELSHNERFETKKSHVDGPTSASVSLASRGRRMINYRVMARKWLGTELKPFESAPDGEMQKPPRNEVLGGVSVEQQVILWHGRRRRKRASTSAVSGYTALPQVPTIAVGGIFGTVARKSLDEDYTDGDEVRLQNFASIALHSQIGSFSRPLFDFTSVNLRLDAGSVGNPYKPLDASEQKPMSLGDRLITADGRLKASPTSVTISFAQQLLGPLRFRTEVRTSGAEALAATCAGLSAIKQRKPMAQVRDVFKKEVASPEVLYGLDCPLPPMLGSARAVVWYNATRQDAFAEIRLFDL